MNRPKRQRLDVNRGDDRKLEASVANAFADEAQLWAAHESALASATQIVESTAQLLDANSRERTVVDALMEAANVARGRADEVGGSMQRVAASFDQLRLVALNAGLEGARLGEPANRALAAVSDEIRVHAERGFEALADIQALLDEIRPALTQSTERVSQLRQTEASVTNQIARVQTLSQQTAQHVSAVGVFARRLSGTDPEDARVLAHAVDDGRSLLSAVSALKDKAQIQTARTALGPLVRSIAALLDDPDAGLSPEEPPE